MKRIAAFLLILTSTLTSLGQSACPSVDAGSDQTLNCTTTCTDLTADVPTNIGETTDYSVATIPYAPPYPFTGGTSLFGSTDDVWSNAINLPFDFCFYNNTFNQIIIGANGLISFDITDAGGYCPWGFTDQVPNANLPVNSIFGMYYDLDPSAGGTPDINYAILGTAPCRTFVVNFSGVRHFSCNTLESTSQIVLYENTNIIDVYIEQHENCPGWNSGNGVVGIQDATGANGIAPAGYNTSPWTANNIAWRFTPTGTSILNVLWYDDAALTNQIGAGTTINVCPNETTTYYTEATYTVCSGPPIVVTDDVTVNMTTGFTLSQTATEITCFGYNDGTINVTTTNGTPNFTFSIDGGLTQANGSFTDLTPGNHIITVTDAAGCTGTIDTTLIEPSQIIITETHVNVDCFGGTTGSIDASVIGGTTPYSYSWNNGPLTEDLSSLNAGTYILTVTDANGCNETLTVVITEQTDINIVETHVDVNCNGGSNGSIDISLTGGDGNYTYDWGSGVITEDLNNLPAGSNTVIVTDGLGCEESLTISVGEPTILTNTSTSANVSFSGGSDGSIDITPNGGTQPYTFLWDNGITTEDLSGLSIGEYCVVITDANGCDIDTCITITEPGGISITLTSTNPSCFSSCDATANLTIDEASGPYTVTWTITGGTIAVDDLSVSGLCTSQTISVTASLDSNPSIFATASTVITEPTEIIAELIQNNESCPGLCDVDMAIEVVSGGISPFTFDWFYESDLINSLNDSISIAGDTTYCDSICPDQPLFCVITDAMGCTDTVFATGTTFTEITATETHIDVDCFGMSTGSIDLTVTGGVAPYNFDWNTGENTEDISNLVAGTYTVTITDTEGCICVCLTIVITEPTQLEASTTSTPANCGAANGTISETISGGTPPYLVDWGGIDPNGVLEGIYPIIITDANGCMETTLVTVSNQAGGIANLDLQTDVSCFGLCDGTATVSLTGGIGPFTYLWDDLNAQTTATAIGLCAGTYAVSITDAVGCISSLSITILEPSELAVNLVYSTNVSCNGLCDGTAGLSVSGGTYPYSFDWGNGELTTEVTGLCPGVYSNIVTDNNGCQSSVGATIIEPSPLSLATTSFDVSCSDACDGQVIVIPSGGTDTGGGYDISWSQGSSNASVTDLCPGDYIVTVTDDNNCTESATETVNAPDAIILTLSTDSSNCGQADGIIYYSASGGSSISGDYVINGPTTESAPNGQFTNLFPGIYCIEVMDDNGCTIEECITIGDRTGFTLSENIITNVSCFGFCDGAISLNINGGNSNNYTYAIGSQGNQTSPTSLPLDGLCAGIYTVEVTDDLGCTSSLTVSINEPSKVNVLAIGNNTICIGGCATIEANASGGTAPYTYDWSLFGNNPSFVDCPIQATTYEVIVTDAQGCTSSPSSVVVDLNPPLSLNLTTIGPDIVCPGESVEIDAIYSGGSGSAYSISWSPIPDNLINPQNPPVTFTPNGMTTITVTITDDCETPAVTQDITIDNYILPILDFMVDENAGCSPHTASFTPDITPTPNSYLWTFGNDTSFNNTSILTNPSNIYTDVGSYDVSLSILSADGCPDTLIINQMVEVYENPIADFTFGPQPTSILLPKVDFDASSSYLADSWDWFVEGDSNSVANSEMMQYIFEYADTIDVTLIVSTVNGCTDTTINPVIIDPDITLFVPTAFTPDGDGLNDYFKPIGIGMDNDDYQFWIYDRWGNVVFQTNDYHQGWDGKVNTTCSFCPDLTDRSVSQTDIFVWKVWAKGPGENFPPIKREGHVTLIR